VRGRMWLLSALWSSVIPLAICISFGQRVTRMAERLS